MKPFQLHTSETAPEESGAILESVKGQLGFVPNVFAVLAESTPALGGFVDLNGRFANSSFTATEREIIEITTSVENQCAYCVAGHTAFAHMQNVSKDIIEAVRSTQPISDARLQALQEFCRSMVVSKGMIPQNEIDLFFAADYTPTHVMEVILGICVKTFSNMASNSVGCPLDDAFKKYKWQFPANRAA